MNLAHQPHFPELSDIMKSMLVFACISPHPPIILPNVGSEADRAKVKKTITALEKLGKQLAKAKPDCLVITSPHPDWGVKVPWFFLKKNIDYLKFNIDDLQSPEKLIFNLKSSIINHKSAVYPVLTTPDSPKQHYQWGQKIAQNLPDKLRFAWIASGDMSHRLKEDGPYGLHPSGPKFDQKFIELLKKKDVQGILNLDPELVEGAGECGLRSFCMLLGALEWQSSSAGSKPRSAGSKPRSDGSKPRSDGSKPRSAWQPKILSYEGPFGVGYLVAHLI